MALHIRGEKADRLIRRLAADRGIGLTEAVELAAENELNKDDDFFGRIRRIQERFKAYPKTGLKADKTFYDSLNDE